MKKCFQNGFTLIELLIVVSIIGILVAISIPQFVQYSMRSKRTESIFFLRAVDQAEMIYFAQSNVFKIPLVNANINGLMNALEMDPMQLKYYPNMGPVLVSCALPAGSSNVVSYCVAIRGNFDPDGWMDIVAIHHFESSCFTFCDTWGPPHQVILHQDDILNI